MSNKTSDKNVANIEDEIKEIKESIEEAYRCYDYDLDYNPFSRGIAEMVEHILAEREQKDKRIKELEEENAILKKASNIAKDVTEIMNKSCEEFMSNYINKQKVIDVIQEYKDKTEKYNEYRVQSKETDVEYYENIANTIVVQVLQELLEGEK